MQYTRNFNQLSKDGAHIAGGKGASLGEMLQNNIPVPDGYVVTADAFDHFIKETDLIQEIDAILDTVDTKSIHTVESASEKIQSLIKNSEMPQDIANEILEQYKSHDMEYVAVRSSATAEDGADHAWAGQLSSYLNTTDRNLLEMVQNCWASLFTPRAIFYRFEKGLHTTHISVAVVVQKMVNSEKSGIAFSVHPVTEDYNQIIIEAGLGLGEAIVSGSVTPDSYVITKEPQEIIDINVNTQNKALYRSTTLDIEHGFNEWKNLPKDQAETQVLNKNQITELSDIIVNIEKHYGFPCDIEWAFESDTFYIVQSRPITTLKPISKEPKITFEKAYTRDTSMIIQQGWNACVTSPYYSFETNPHTPPVIHYMNDGVIEIWENEKATQWILDSLQDFIKKNEQKLISLIDQYEEDLEDMKVIWENGQITSSSELESFTEKVFGVMKGFDTMYFPSVDERTPEHIRERTLKLRDEDVYFDTCDKLIRDSLITIYPELRGYESAILKSEINNPPSKEILAKRKEGFVVIGQEFADQITLREYLSKNPEYKFHIETPPADSSTLIGQVGNKGYAKGIVRIMKRKDQIDEAQEGDIIVSTMTTPDFVPAMKKAAAIITDEGGVTCHAAIVAREMDKPCVIGTKFATQILKDGDLVEVDADNGIVKILESKKQDDYMYYTVPMYAITNYFHGGLSASLKYKDTYLCGLWHGKYCYEGNSEAVVSRDAFIPYGNTFISYIEKEDQEFTDTLFRKYMDIIDLGDKLQSLNKQWYKDRKAPELSKYYDEYIELFPWVIGIGYSIDTALESYTDKHKINLAELTIPGHSFLYKEEESLHQVANNKKDLEEHKAEYSFILSNYKGYKEVPEEHFTDRLDEVRSKNFQKELEIIKPVNMEEWVAFFIYIRDERKRCNMLFNVLYLEYIKAECKKYDLSYEDAVLLMPDEFEEQKKSGTLTKFNGIRYTGTTHDGVFSDISENDWQNLLKNVEGSGEVQGIVASSGNATGRVSVVLNDDDFKKVQDGDVIAASMTRPDFVPILRKAAAIVTNEGGVTCHAAIISRELNIPCVIGTQNATKVLKDGDLVEVDADNGIVNIIEKAE